MGYVKKLVYLTEAQKNTLFANGSITVGSKTITYDPNDVYVTPRDIPDFQVGTVETLPAGSQATASITGTGDTPVINLGIPEGDQGDKGDKGDSAEYIRIQPEIITIPCDENGLALQTDIIPITFVAMRGENQIACSTLTNYSEQNKWHYLGVYIYPVWQCTPDNGGQLQIDVTAGIAPLGAYVSRTISPVFTLSNGTQIVASFTILAVRKGDKGDPGSKGDPGEKGDTGATPDLTIGTVQTLPAGSSATASITGTPEDPVLNLGIPKGDTGEVTQAEFDALADDVSDIQDTLEHKADIDGYYTDMTVGAAEQVVSSTMVEDNAPYKLRTSGGSTDIGNQAYVDKIVGGTVAWNQQVRDAASENVTEYADVVTVTDAVEDDAAVSVMVEPVQDLHGYDSPWPAGGGKNKFPVSEWFKQYDSSVNYLLVGDTSAFLSAGTYTLSFEYYVDGATSLNTFWRSYSEHVTYVDTTKQTGFGAIGLSLDTTSYTWKAVTFTLENDAWVGIDDGQLRGGVHYRNIQIESGSSRTSFAPYSNICPISGWDEVNVWDDPVQGGTVEWNQIFPTRTINYSGTGFTITSDNNGVVVVTVTTDGTSENNAHNHTNMSIPSSVNGHKCILLSGSSDVKVQLKATSTESDVVFTATAGYNNVAFMFNNLSIGTYNVYPMLCDLTLMFGAGNEPTTVAEFRALFPNGFYPYNTGETMTVGQVNGETYRHYTIEMPTEAGTVYGCELTVNKDGSGSLVVDMAMMDMGSMVWNYNTTYAFFTSNSISTRKIGVLNVWSDMFKTMAGSWSGTPVQNALWGNGSNITLYVQIPPLDNANDFMALVDGHQLMYELATPITYTLTASQVQTLLGTNHVWSDAGQLSLTYTGTDEHLVLTSGRKYLTRINGTDSMVLGAGQEVTAVKGRDNVFDLTQMLGTSVADYVYQQGASYFRKWFGGTRYAYNAGELLSVEGLQSREVVGFNQWDWQTNSVLGELIDSTDGSFAPSRVFPDQCWRSGYIKVLPNTRYYISGFGSSCFNLVCFYDMDKTFLSRTSGGVTSIRDVTTPSNCSYVAFTLYMVNASQTFTDNRSGICINLAHNDSRNGSYEPYTHRSYPLDSTVVLRGIPKVGTNGVYWDGDEYAYDGGVKRRYKTITVNESLRWYKDADINGYNRYYFADNSIKRYTSYVGLIPNTKGYENAQGYNLYFVSSDIAISLYNLESGTNSGKNWFYIGLKTSLGINTLEAFIAWLASNNFDAVVELATSTTETATPYQHIQSVDDWGTEEFVSGTITPVGHLSKYTYNLRDKLQHLPNLAGSNGKYIISQSGSDMTLVPYESGLPTVPSANGSYVLKCTVTNGVVSYSWVAS